jgi:hypothetical protein
MLLELIVNYERVGIFFAHNRFFLNAVIREN